METIQYIFVEERTVFEKIQKNNTNETQISLSNPVLVSRHLSLDKRISLILNLRKFNKTLLNFVFFFFLIILKLKS